MPSPPEDNIQWLPGYLVTCLPHPPIMLCLPHLKITYSGYLVTCLPHPQIMLFFQLTRLSLYLFSLPSLTKCYQVTGGYSTCCRRLSLYLFSLPSLTKCYQVTELPRNRTLIKSSLLPISSHYCLANEKSGVKVLFMRLDMSIYFPCLPLLCDSTGTYAGITVDRSGR